MRRIFRFWKIVLLDTLGVIFMIGALLTGWLPGPGGIPLFIAGLGLLAINHEWAEKYIDMIKDYADRLFDLVFVDNPLVQNIYDFLAFGLSVTGIWLILNYSHIWQLSIAIGLTLAGLTLFFGNRHRFRRIKKRLSRPR